MNIKDDRQSFEETVLSFQEFLRSQGLNQSLLWLTGKQIVGHKCRFWLYRPQDLRCSESSMRFFEETRSGDWNLAICALTQFKDHTLAYVERGHGKSRMLNLSIITTNAWSYRFVDSKTLWLLIRIYCGLRGLAPFLKFTRMTPG
jgi:hypothetical protein